VSACSFDNITNNEKSYLPCESKDVSVAPCDVALSHIETTPHESEKKKEEGDFKLNLSSIEREPSTVAVAAAKNDPVFKVAPEIVILES
jgi:hypothetical protein